MMEKCLQNGKSKWFPAQHTILKRKYIKQIWESIDIYNHEDPLKFTFYVPFLKKLIEDVLHQNKRVNQERERHGI